jgi:hypothetical protein
VTKQGLIQPYRHTFLEAVADENSGIFGILDSQDIDQLVGFFTKKLGRVQAYWYLHPFAKGLSLDFILHTGNRPNPAEERIHDKTQRWVSYLIPSVMGDIYMYVIQQKSSFIAAEKDWSSVTANFREYRATAHGREYCVSWHDPPAAEAHGNGTPSKKQKKGPTSVVDKKKFVAPRFGIRTKIELMANVRKDEFISFASWLAHVIPRLGGWGYVTANFHEYRASKLGKRICTLMARSTSRGTYSRTCLPRYEDVQHMLRP